MPKISQEPTVTSMSTSDIFLVNVGGTTSTISLANLNTVNSGLLIPPQVYSGTGVNYQSYNPNASTPPQPYWDQDIAYFKQVGVTGVRPTQNELTIPWTNPTTVYGTNNYQLFRDCAIYFATAGFFVTYGPAGPAGMGNYNSGSLTATLWSSYETAVLAEATYLVANGIDYGEFSIGNEMEAYIDNSTLTKAQLISNISSLATSVKAISGWKMPVSYGTDNNSNFGGTNWSMWITNGLGGLDFLSLHPYGSIDVNAQTVGNGTFSNLAAVLTAFGNRCYVSEFNLDSNANNLAALSSTVGVPAMNNFIQTYLLNQFSRFFVYVWSHPSYPSSQPGFNMYQGSGVFNPLWSAFFVSNQYTGN